MAQYCEIAGKVTNCTDNCKVYLEEEKTNQKQQPRTNNSGLNK